MSDIHMIYVPVSIGSFTVSLDAEFSGQVSGIQTWHIEAGIQASVNDGVNLIRSIETRSSTLDTAATAKFAGAPPGFAAYSATPDAESPVCVRSISASPMAVISNMVSTLLM